MLIPVPPASCASGAYYCSRSCSRVPLVAMPAVPPVLPLSPVPVVCDVPFLPIPVRVDDPGALQAAKLKAAADHVAEKAAAKASAATRVKVAPSGVSGIGVLVHTYC